MGRDAEAGKEDAEEKEEVMDPVTAFGLVLVFVLTACVVVLKAGGY